ncbi:hypothetical protein D3880_06920 [Pseudomonas cavernae]|uniref:Lipoprotein n=1 Tax=Pseudomonas cavernae TaxID=2320867 RepID=A0A385Z0F0_9PSED|nr:hypothetical protein [Pseudomonas cavernae]AYC32131.1 hypothetical protein D3880_06920 [Pseudomonas cavernae]
MNKIARVILLSAAALSLSACFKDDAGIDQSGLCTYNTDAQAERCKPGQLAWFRPEQQSNEQVQLSVAAAYCDFNYQVMYNRSGVVCVFTDKRLNVVK